MKGNHFLKRIKIAFLGLVGAFEKERNFKIQVWIALGVIFLMLVLNLSPIEKSILILMILLVLGLELINSQIEKFLDIIEPRHHPKVKVIKDFSAGAVLLSVVGSVVIGILILAPHLI